MSLVHPKRRPWSTLIYPMVGYAFIPTCTHKIMLLYIYIYIIVTYIYIHMLYIYMDAVRVYIYIYGCCTRIYIYTYMFYIVVVWYIYRLVIDGGIMYFPISTCSLANITRNSINFFRHFPAKSLRVWWRRWVNHLWFIDYFTINSQGTILNPLVQTYELILITINPH